jgi:hypothetical protein
MKTYIHKTEQRLRVRSDFIRNNPRAVKLLINDLNIIDAIQQIRYKRYAGSVALSFDHKELDCDSLLEILESHKWTEESNKPSFIENAVTTGTKSLTKSVAGLAIKYALGASVSRVIMSL